MKKDHLKLVGSRRQRDVEEVSEIQMLPDGLGDLFSELGCDILEEHETYAIIEFGQLIQKKILIELAVIDDNIMIEILEGYEDDERRLMASDIMEQIIEGVRFLHRDKFWTLSKYHVLDKKEYAERCEETFLEEKKDEILHELKRAKHDPIDEDLQFLTMVEGIHQLHLLIVGVDGKLLSEKFEQWGIGTKRDWGNNTYEIVIAETGDDLGDMNWKYSIEKVLYAYGYNVFLDYEETE